MISDASLQNLEGGRTFGAFAAGATTQALQEGKVAPVSLRSFRSCGVRRVVSSTLAGETLSLSDGCYEVTWLRAMWAEAVGPSLGRD